MSSFLTLPLNNLEESKQHAVDTEIQAASNMLGSSNEFKERLLFLTCENTEDFGNTLEYNATNVTTTKVDGVDVDNSSTQRETISTLQPLSTTLLGQNSEEPIAAITAEDNTLSLSNWSQGCDQFEASTCTSASVINQSENHPQLQTLFDVAKEMNVSKNCGTLTQDRKEELESKTAMAKSMNDRVHTLVSERDNTEEVLEEHKPNLEPWKKLGSAPKDSEKSKVIDSSNKNLAAAVTREGISHVQRVIPVIEMPTVRYTMKEKKKLYWRGRRKARGKGRETGEGTVSTSPNHKTPSTKSVSSAKGHDGVDKVVPSADNIKADSQVQDSFRHEKDNVKAVCKPVSRHWHAKERKSGAGIPSEQVRLATSNGESRDSEMCLLAQPSLSPTKHRTNGDSSTPKTTSATPETASVHTSDSSANNHFSKMVAGRFMRGGRSVGLHQGGNRASFLDKVYNAGSDRNYEVLPVPSRRPRYQPKSVNQIGQAASANASSPSSDDWTSVAGSVTVNSTINTNSAGDISILQAPIEEMKTVSSEAEASTNHLSSLVKTCSDTSLVTVHASDTAVNSANVDNFRQPVTAKSVNLVQGLNSSQWSKSRTDVSDTLATGWTPVYQDIDRPSSHKSSTQRIQLNLLPKYHFGRKITAQNVNSTVTAPNAAFKEQSKYVAANYLDPVHPRLRVLEQDTKATPQHKDHVNPKGDAATEKVNSYLETSNEGSTSPVDAKVSSKVEYIAPHLRTPETKLPTNKEKDNISKTKGTKENRSVTFVQSNSSRNIYQNPTASTWSLNVPTETPTTANGKARSDQTLPAEAAVAGWNGPIDVRTMAKGKARAKQALKFEAPMAGWNGPEPSAATFDWLTRPSFDNTDGRHKNLINSWLADRANEAIHSPVIVNTNSPGFVTGDAPAGGEEKLGDPMAPESHRTLPPNDPFTDARKTQTSVSVSEKHRLQVQAEQVATKEERRQWRADYKAHMASYVPAPNPHKPQANIYIRPAVRSDMGQIAEIYNHYVQHSVAVCEQTPLDETQWRARWVDSDQDGNYAFLVAVQKGGKGGGRNRRQGDEVIVGFAYADDFGSDNNAYRYTCELQVFVSSWHTRKGVGKTLMDRMLFSMDPMHMIRGGTDFLGAGDSGKYEFGGQRIIKSILISILYLKDDASTFEWQKKYLKAQWGFEHAGTLPGIGRKKNKFLNVAQLIKETGTNILPYQ